MKKSKVIMLVGLLIFVVIGIFIIVRFVSHKTGNHTHQSDTEQQQYTCPMHPTYISDKPGSCPICGMDLVPIKKSVPNATKKNMYKSTMNPNEISDKPGKDSMGMEMVPFEVEEKLMMSVVKGLSEITISPEKQQLIGVKTESVTWRELKVTVNAAGRVAFDPELYNAINEYRQALKTQTETLIKSAYTKLQLFGFDDTQINEMVKVDNVNLILPQDIAWVYAQVYEHEISLVKIGQKIEVTAPAYPGKVFTGTVKAIHPMIDVETRSLKIHAEVDNPNHELKPEMYVNVKIGVRLGNKLSVPESAIIDSGERQIVFIAKSDGVFEPRKVRIGRQAGDYVEVVSGLIGNEKVVTSANFLIDSESKLKSAIKGMSAH